MDSGKFADDKTTSSGDVEKGVGLLDQTEETSSLQEGVVHETEVKRGLKSRHVSMIALGGTIGTGLFIGTAAPLRIAGPASTLISYIFFGVLAYFVTQALGEMATHTPISGSFCTFNTRYISKAVGFATNWCYWFSWAITFAIELFAVAQVIEYWTDKCPSWAWMLIFYFILTGANFVPVSFYGEVEFWVSLIKILAIIGFLIYALAMVCGAGAQGVVGFHHWKNPGAWGPGAGLVSNITTDRFLGWVSSLINAAFTYQGVELTGIAAGESSNPRKTVPKAINKVIFRILIFYILTLFFIGMLVPYNDPNLDNTTTFISSSPFLISIQISGTPVLPGIFNGVMLCTIISAGNSNIYIGSRILYSMAGTTAPSCYRWTTKQGIPWVGVVTTSLFGLLAFLNVSNNGQTVFAWLMNITAVAGLTCWIFISAAHLRFMAILKSRNISRDTLPFKARFMPFFGWFTLVSLVIIIFIQGYTVFFDFSVNDFFAYYVSLIMFFVFWIVSQLTLYRHEPWVIPMDTIDIDSEARKIDEEIWEDEPKQMGKWESIWDTIM
ncbi:DEKNAAC104707 [Brettanomyces naardenensis]|uniref:DEKNAAC104707 n=1 Tax=Brettanomyces naardenensis TaxID=13370 RepID=A0A448YRN7_BRENA|nr:DEKNAAC104707 [Brettanomyces naardenensis]